jgi:acyl-CoA thioesterase FadM
LGSPPIIHRTTVSEEWIDYNNHMTEHAYSLVFGMALEEFIRSHGLGREYCETTGRTCYTLASQIHFVREARGGSLLEIDLLLLDAADNMIHVFQCMYDADRQLKATYEAIVAHVNQRPQPKVEPFPIQVQAAFKEVQSQHAGYGWPARAGVAIGIRRDARAQRATAND